MYFCCDFAFITKSYAVVQYVSNIYVIICVMVSFTDVDECSEGIARCPQECINTEGSYTCNCSAGYQASNYSCAGAFPFPFSIYI